MWCVGVLVYMRRSSERQVPGGLFVGPRQLEDEKQHRPYFPLFPVLLNDLNFYNKHVLLLQEGKDPFSLYPVEMLVKDMSGEGPASPLHLQWSRNPMSPL